jgi:rod shape-determining protein MreC
LAPPSTRRTGFSRRAQYGLFMGYVVAVGGIMLAILLLVVAIFDPKGFSALKGVALDVTTPVSSGGRSIVRFFGNAGESIGNYFFAASKNAELRRELEAARPKAIEAQALALENRRLKALLGLSRAIQDDVASAHIVGSSFDSARRMAVLNAGSADGVGAGQPVRGPEGLIGRILESGRYSSRVLLITDGASNVPVQLVSDGTPAIATGRGDGAIDIKPLEVGANRFKRGDIFVTSGVGGIYPPRIPVAVVTQATRDDTIARPIADPARIDFAIVQQIYEPEVEALGNSAEAEP